MREGDVKDKGVKHRRLNELKADEAAKQIQEYTKENTHNDFSA